MRDHVVMIAVGMGLYPADFQKGYDYLRENGQVPPEPESVE